MTVSITVDGRQLAVDEAMSVLEACLANDIYIPNLCHMDGMAEPPASCRLCMVEIAGIKEPVTACTVTVTEAMAIQTDTPAVRRLQRTALRLLLSVHHVDCKNCPANKRCELQRLARFLKVGLKVKGLETHLKTPAVDDTHPFLTYHPNRCVLCGKCIAVCRSMHGQSRMAFAGRGFDTVIHFYGGMPAGDLPCASCTACVDICPVGALMPKTA